MASIGLPFPPEGGRSSTARRSLTTPSPRLTREGYIHRIAVAWIVTGGVDPRHPARSVKLVEDGKSKEFQAACVCRLCRAWICIRQTPADELVEAKAYAERLQATAEYIDDRLFG